MNHSSCYVIHNTFLFSSHLPSLQHRDNIPHCSKTASTMKQKNNLEGSIERLPENQIYLNIDDLEDGTYVLKITHKNKIIKKATFKKNNSC